MVLMMLRFFVTLLAFLAIGCATIDPIKGPDGTDHLLISCNSVEYCYEEATKSCGGPYKIVNTSSDTSGADGVTSTTVKLLVKCGPG